jgi:hypothetical protein
MLSAVHTRAAGKNSLGRGKKDENMRLRLLADIDIDIVASI